MIALFYSLLIMLFIATFVLIINDSGWFALVTLLTVIWIIVGAFKVANTTETTLPIRDTVVGKYTKTILLEDGTTMTLTDSYQIKNNVIIKSIKQQNCFGMTRTKKEAWVSEGTQ